MGGRAQCTLAWLTRMDSMRPAWDWAMFVRAAHHVVGSLEPPVGLGDTPPSTQQPALVHTAVPPGVGLDPVTLGVLKRREGDALVGPRFHFGKARSPNLLGDACPNNVKPCPRAPGIDGSSQHVGAVRADTHDICARSVWSISVQGRAAITLRQMPAKRSSCSYTACSPGRTYRSPW